MRQIHTLFLLLGSLFWMCSPSRLEESIPPKETHTLKWVKTFGGSEEDIAHDVIITRDGGFALLGNTQSVDGDVAEKTRAGSDLLLIKYDPQGQLEWYKTYGGSKDDRGHSLYELPEGGYVLLGYAMSADGDLTQNQGHHDNWVLKVDAQGEVLWQRSFGFSGHDHAYNIIPTHDGGFLFNGFLDVTASEGQGATAKGTSNASRHGVGEFWCHKIDAQGQLQWRKYFGGTSNDRSYAATALPDGSFVLAGTSESQDVDIQSPKGGYDIWVVKIDHLGNMLWENTFGGTDTDGANAVIYSQDKLYVLGDTRSHDKNVSSPLGNADFWLLTLDLEGRLIQEKTYGGSDFDLGRDLIIDYQQRYWLTGYSRSQDIDLSENHGDNDVVLLQLDSNQHVQQHFTVGGSGQDLGHALVQRQGGGIVVVGSTQSRNGDIANSHGGKDVFIAFWDAIIE